MLQNKTRLAIVAVLLLAVLITVLFSIRAVRQTTPIPTISVSRVQTEAVATFAAGLTSTAAAMPTSSATGTPLPTSTFIETEAISPTPSCYRMKFITDITIQDNTPLSPADVFTKTWRVENNGLCAWRPGFKLVLVGGDAMGGSPLILSQAINPGERTEISVKMAAPTDQTGAITGAWRMTDDNGTFFGDTLTVVITIGGSGTSTSPTLAATTAP
jgi:hypothetical protein